MFASWAPLLSGGEACGTTGFIFPFEGELGGAGGKLNFRELRLGSLDGSEFGSLDCSWSNRFFCFLPWKLGDHMVILSESNVECCGEVALAGDCTCVSSLCVGALWISCETEA